MLNTIYKAIKQQLTDNDTASKLKGIEWYNVQYDSTIANTPRIFIEFPEPLNFEAISREARRSKIRIRLHVVSQAITENDGTIPDTVGDEHEDVALWAQGVVDGFTPADGSCQRITFNTWQHWHKYRGWMVTFLEFDAKKML